jgi:hypothetical protein
LVPSIFARNAAFKPMKTLASENKNKEPKS